MAAINGCSTIFGKVYILLCCKLLGQKFSRNHSVLHHYGILRIFHFHYKENRQPRQARTPGTAKLPTTLRFGKILGTTSVLRSTEKIHWP